MCALSGDFLDEWPFLSRHARRLKLIAMLSELVAAHEHDYVRMIGIDPHARRRVMEVIIHKPGEPVTLSTTGGGSQTSSFSSCLWRLECE